MHEGFTNYQTWLVNMFICSDVDILYSFKELDTESIRQVMEESMPIDGDTILWYDLLQSALDLVNWDELVDSLRSK